MKEKSPLISVVIATYQRASLLTHAIQSVRDQTFTNIQIIVVDDGSSDNTSDVIKQINDPRIEYIRHSTNKGQSVGRNTGIEVARGEYVAFLDDDDFWESTKLEKQVKHLQAHKFDAILCASIGSGGRIRRHQRSSVGLSDLKKGNEFAPGSGLLVKTPVMKQLLFDDSLGQGEDWDVLIRLAQKNRIGYLDEVLYTVNEGDHQRMTNEARLLSVNDMDKSMKVIHKHKDLLGAYWFNFHVADTLLSFLWERPDKLQRITCAVKQCGLIPVMASLWSKACRKLTSPPTVEGKDPFTRKGR